MSGGWGLCQQDPSHASSRETPLQLSDGPVGSGLQEKGVPLATRTPGRSQSDKVGTQPEGQSRARLGTP